jgi:putative transposase
VLTEFGLKIAPSTYYAALTRRPSRRAVRDEELKTMIVKIYEENYSVYGAKKAMALRLGLQQDAVVLEAVDL